MKRLLYISALPPSNNGGGESLTLNTIRSMSKKFDIDLIYFSYYNHKNLAIPYVKEYYEFNPSCLNCLKKLFLFPLFTRRFNKEVLSFIRNNSSNYDVIFFDYSQTAIYSRYIIHPKKIVRCHDIILQKYSRKNKLLLPWIKYSENLALNNTSQVFTLSEKDNMILAKNYNIHAIAINDFFAETNFVINKKIQLTDSFVFLGYWARSENLEGLLWFIKKVIPLLDREKKIQFKIMGKGLSTKIVSQFLIPNDIKYLGFVDDLLGEIVQNNALIVPLFQGAGVKIKVIDSFHTGTPVIGTSIAFEGIPNFDGLTYECNKPKEFANIINSFNPLTLEEKKIKKNIFESTVNKGKIVDIL